MYKDCNILVDTGMSSAYRNLNKNIRELQAPGGKIDYLILTHTHFDHCRNAARIKEQYACRIIAGENEKDFAESGYTPVPCGTKPITKIISRIGAKPAQKLLRYKAFIPDILTGEYYDLEEGEPGVKIIKTNGHSPGSLSVLVDNEIGIVGDTLFGVFSNSVFPPFADNQPEMIKSWNKLLHTECKIFLPGHGKEIERKLLQKEYYKYSQKEDR
jgi:glyoxylase-like metal-dependent hydrolase (beta-lactamase superfamily II)